MKIKKIEINFGKIKYGWISILLKADKRDLVFIRGSGVFNPFYNYVEMLDTLKNKRKTFKWEIEEEGPETHFEIKNLGKILKIKIIKYCSNDQDTWIPETIIYVNKKQFIEEFRDKAVKLFYKNKKEIVDPDYSFFFNVNQLKKIRYKKDKVNV